MVNEDAPSAEFKEDAPTRNANPREDAYYAALLNAWFENRMERDRTLLALSAGGLALLVAVLTAFRINTALVLVLHVLAAIAFLVAIAAGVLIFHGNTSYLKQEKDAFETGDGPSGPDRALRCLDRVLGWAFMAGAALTVLLAIVSAYSGMGVCGMPEKKQTGSAPVVIKESVDGAAAMRPKELVGKSVDGAAAMRPAKPAESANPKPSQPPGGPQQGGTGSGAGGSSGGATGGQQ